MEEQEIDTVPFVVDPQPALAADEGKIIPEFQEEGLKMADQGPLEITFGILVLQSLFRKARSEPPNGGDST